MRSATKTTATKKGLEDFLAGIPIEECPYPHDTAPRKHWLAAYIEARTQSRLKHIYERYPNDNA